MTFTVAQQIVEPLPSSKPPELSRWKPRYLGGFQSSLAHERSEEAIENLIPDLRIRDSDQDKTIVNHFQQNSADNVHTPPSVRDQQYNDIKNDDRFSGYDSLTVKTKTPIHAPPNTIKRGKCIPLAVSARRRPCRLIGLGRAKRVSQGEEDEETNEDLESIQCNTQEEKHTEMEFTILREQAQESTIIVNQGDWRLSQNSLPGKENIDAIFRNTTSNNQIREPLHENPNNQNKYIKQIHSPIKPPVHLNYEAIPKKITEYENPKDDLEEKENLYKYSADPYQKSYQIPSTPSTKGCISINGHAYLKLSLIGKGGSSKVYRVLCQKTHRIYAVKRVNLSDSDSSTIIGYKNEINLLKKLKHHPRIIQLIDSEINTHKEYLYMVMEIGEIDLANILQKQNGRFKSLNYIRLYWEQMLEAVQAVHQQGIVHSDLKPANFLLVEGSLKIIDFGIAKAIGNDTTNIHRETQIGTVNYMSPEALIEISSEGGHKLIKCGRASDVWSLGCILYQMVYGKTPFAHLSMVQKVKCIPDDNYKINFTPELDSNSGAKVCPALIRLMKACLERDQKKRPTIDELLKDDFLWSYKESNSSTESQYSPLSLNEIQWIVKLAANTFKRENITEENTQRLVRDAFAILSDIRKKDSY